MSLRQNILAALAAFIKSRPGLEFANYGDASSYRAEMRSITRDRHHAETLLASVSWRESIDAAALQSAFNGAFSGRLSLTVLDGDRVRLEYCAGQYYPTEYRRAACAVLSAALWAYFRNNGAKTGDEIRKTARAEFGASIANRWFN